MLLSNELYPMHDVRAVHVVMGCSAVKVQIQCVSFFCIMHTTYTFKVDGWSSEFLSYAFTAI